MTKKDLMEIKKKIRDKSGSVLSRIAICYVDIGHDEMIYIPPKMIENMEESEMTQYLAFFKKSLGGKRGSGAVEINVRGKGDTFPLEKLRACELKEEEQFREICEQIKSVYHAEDNYSIIAGYGAYDIPTKAEDNQVNDYDEVYRFILLTINPCAYSKPELFFDYDAQNFLDSERKRLLSSFECSFLYPAFSERHSDIDTCLLGGKNAAALESAQAIVTQLFGSKMPISATTQREGFSEMIYSAAGGSAPYEKIQEIYESISDMQAQSDADPEGASPVLSAREVADIIEDKFDLSDEGKKRLEDVVVQYEDNEFSVDNLVPKVVNIEANQAVVKVSVQDVADIERRTIDGRSYLLIPCDSATVEGIVVK